MELIRLLHHLQLRLCLHLLRLLPLVSPLWEVHPMVLLGQALHLDQTSLQVG